MYGTKVSPFIHSQGAYLWGLPKPLTQKGFIIALVFLAIAQALRGQDHRVSRSVWLRVQSDTIRLDSLSVIPGSLQVFRSDSLPVEPGLWQLIEGGSSVVFKAPYPEDSLLFRYKVFPFDFGRIYFHKSAGIISLDEPSQLDPFLYRPFDSENAANTGFSSLNRSGSVSRGLAFGNTQDLSVNSTLNLQLSGKLSDEISILASVTDDNLPIQPQGNTQQLQDFDRVFIQLYDDRNKLIAGDFQLKSRESYFLKYFKRSQGATFESNFNWSPGMKGLAEASVAVSKGKFARNSIQGIEGNQGPYRLRGSDNERFIIVLAGTEKVYIDGRLLQRGQEFDYIIDYNTAEIIFTAKQRITKDRRIIAEFQYSDKNYARSLVQAHVEAKNDAGSSYIGFYSEQDARNQPLQQDLDDEAREILRDAGDDLNLAVSSGIDSVGFSDDAVLYLLRDSLGYDSVFVFSADPQQAFWRVSFSPVGAGNGDYVEDLFTALGRTFRWVAPDTINNVIVRRGDHAPVIALVPPQKRQAFVAGAQRKLSRNWSVGGEGMLSVLDRNTFSPEDAGDDDGLGSRIWLRKELPAGDSLWRFVGDISYEFTSKNFSPVERFRAVEFERNWNLSLLAQPGEIHLPGLRAGIAHPRKGKLLAGADYLETGSGNRGLKAVLLSDIRLESGRIFADASFLENTGAQKTSFLRHRSLITRKLGKNTLGYKDEHEWNRYFDPTTTDSLLSASYQFYEWQAFAERGDTSGTYIRGFYGGREDLRPLQNRLRTYALAEEYGTRIGWNPGPGNSGSFSLSDRRLRITNDSLAGGIQPERSLLGRIDQRFRLGKGWLGGDMFYEINSGLEQRREFIYLEVPAGQGVFVWNDYNSDGVKDLNEFEVAAFSYEANYIRSFTPSDEYSRTYGNDLSLTLNLRPSARGKGSGSRITWIDRFSDQFAWRLNRKTSRERGLERFNPFSENLEDTVLLAQSLTFRNTLFFNRANATFGADYTVQGNGSRNLLANGFEDRELSLHVIRLRWSPSRLFTVEASAETGGESAASDFLSNRNFDIGYYRTGPSLTWQKDNSLRITLSGAYSNKSNSEEFGGEEAQLSDAALELRYNVPSKSSLVANVRAVEIRYSGESANNSLAFEMLEGLTPGTNFTWSFSWQRTLPGNLQLNITYDGRRSEGRKNVHAGGVQARAFF